MRGLVGNVRTRVLENNAANMRSHKSSPMLKVCACLYEGNGFKLSDNECALPVISLLIHVR